MSCLWCHYCGGLVDTDEDPEALFDTDDRLDVVMCETCRNTPIENIRENDLANEADFALERDL